LAADDRGRHDRAFGSSGSGGFDISANEQLPNWGGLVRHDCGFGLAGSLDYDETVPERNFSRHLKMA
jgi:hypothetical protein